MDSSDLTPAAANKLRDDIAGMLRYLNRLTQRCQRRGFPVGDPLFLAATRARDTMQDLHTAAHYAGCSHGAGREERA